jgi:hypothetical protein
MLHLEAKSATAKLSLQHRKWAAIENSHFKSIPLPTNCKLYNLGKKSDGDPKNKQVQREDEKNENLENKDDQTTYSNYKKWNFVRSNYQNTIIWKLTFIKSNKIHNLDECAYILSDLLQNMINMFYQK